MVKVVHQQIKTRELTIRTTQNCSKTTGKGVINMLISLPFLTTLLGRICGDFLKESQIIRHLVRRRRRSSIVLSVRLTIHLKVNLGHSTLNDL